MQSLDYSSDDCPSARTPARKRPWLEAKQGNTGLYTGIGGKTSNSVAFSGLGSKQENGPSKCASSLTISTETAATCM